MTTPRVLIAGVGNIFRGDDGFGVEVVRALAATAAEQPLPPDAVARDYGIRGLHLAYELLEPPALLILVDAVTCGEPPGTLFVLEPQSLEGVPGASADPHGMDVSAVLASVKMLGGQLPRVVILGCQPAALDVDDGMGLSPAVAQAVAPAVQWIRKLVNETCSAGAAGRETSHEVQRNACP